MAKTLILYYSRAGENHFPGGMKVLEEGNTHRVARMMAEASGADLFQVEPVEAYAESYKACVGQAVAQWKGNARPEVKEIPANVGDYDTLVVGYPIWCGTMPMCLYTVLEKLDLTGKKVYALATHEGSAFAQSVDHLKTLCPGAEVEAGFEVKGSMIDATEAEIRAWAREHL